MKKLLLIGLLLIPTPGFSSFAHWSTATVTAAQVPSTQTNYVAYISITDARFKTTGNGGYVQDSNGFDIRPYTSSSCSSALTYELVGGSDPYSANSYDGTTGHFEMWILFSSFTSSTTVTLCYGDAALNTNGSSTSTWTGAGYSTSEHWSGIGTSNGNASVDSVVSLSSGGWGMFGCNACPTVTTKIGNAVTLDGSNDFFELSGALITTTVDFSIAIYFKSSSSAAQYMFGKANGCAAFTYWGMELTAAGKLRALGNNHDHNLDRSVSSNSSSNADGNWHRVVWTRTNSGADWAIYIDGSLDINSTGGNAPSLTDDGGSNRVGTIETCGEFFNGSVDEYMVINGTAVDANWVATDYSMLNNNSSFWTLGLQDGGGGPRNRGLIIGHLDLPSVRSILDAIAGAFFRPVHA